MSELTQDEKLAALKLWRDAMLAVDTAEDALKASVGRDPEAPLPQAIRTLQMLATRQVTALVGDDEDWCAYFWLANDMGARRRQVTFADGRKRRLRTVADLLWVIQRR